MRPPKLNGIVRKRCIVSGRVQGVFFRDTCRHLARREGVAGWVRNAPDGTVEAAFEGPAEAVDRMVVWMRLGPPDARVDGMQVFDEAPRGDTRFAVRG